MAKKRRNKKCFWCGYTIETHEAKSRLKINGRLIYVHSDACLKPMKAAKRWIDSYATQSAKMMLKYLKKILINK